MTSVEIPENLRPELQRTELGPILNHLALQILDRAEAGWNPDSLVSVFLARRLRGEPFMYGNLEQFTQSLCEPLERPLTGVELPEEAKQAIDGLIGTETNPLMNPEKKRKLTYFDTLEKVLAEGLKSGVVMPMHGYCAIEKTKLGTANWYPDFYRCELSRGGFVDTFRDKAFQAMMLQASHTRHGLYSTKSVEFGLTKNANPFAYFSSRPVQELPNGNWALGPSIRNYLRQELNAANDPEFPEFIRTDGCPVRRSTYKELGATARRYAELMDTPIEELMFQPESAIVRSCEYIAACMERLDARIKELDQSGLNFEALSPSSL